VPSVAASADFAIDKAAGVPCPTLRPDFRCGIHARLRDRGFSGCTSYDCFGAGQTVTQVTFGGRNWRESPSTASAMFAAFPVMRALHELLWYLTEARALPHLADEVDRCVLATQAMTRLGPAELAALDVDAHRSSVNGILRRVSELARAEHRGPDRAGADLIGSDLAGADLRGASLRGAYLVGTDLTGADLTLADLTGADLRGALLRGASLGRALFLTQSQVDSAVGDAATSLPAARARPAHWS
jgi:uncharacterized protein YjbI with pentapeptide repeats